MIQKKTKVFGLLLAFGLALTMMAVMAVQNVHATDEPQYPTMVSGSLKVTATSYETADLTWELSNIPDVDYPEGTITSVAFYRVVDAKAGKAEYIGRKDGWNQYSWNNEYTAVLNYGKSNTIVAYFYVAIPDGSGGYEKYLQQAQSVTVKGKTIGKNSLAITKIDANKARITVKRNLSHNYTNVYSAVQVKNGSSWKTIKSKLGGKSSTSAFTYKVKKAGSKAYRVISYYKDYKGTMHKALTSGTYKPQSNVFKTGRSAGNPKNYTYKTARFVPTKFYYSSKGKLVVKGAVGNTRIFDLKKIKVKVTVKCQGKTIASQTFTTTKVKANKNKNVTYTFKKAKKGYDLKNGNVVYSIAVTPTWPYK